MNQSFDLIIQGGSCVTPSGLKRLDIGIIEGRIAALGELSSSRSHAWFQAHGLWIFPGVIDSQVHFREPGLTHKEDLESGSRSALLGGVTSFLDMPNTQPATTRAEHLIDKLGRAADHACCDYGFFIGATQENARNLSELEKLPGCAGIKVFMGSSTGDLLIESDEGLRAVLAHSHRPVAIHSEHTPRLRQRAFIAERGEVARHPEWRDVATALLATKRLIGCARKLGRRRVHVLHVSTAEEIAFLAKHKDLVSIEVTPQHLTLAAPDCYQTLGTYAQMNPPIRSKRHRAALWQGLTQGIVDVIGSDHAPHTVEDKARPYPKSPSGMPGVGTLLPVMLNHVYAGRLSPARLADLTAAGPAHVFGLIGKGQIALNYDADLALVDPKGHFHVSSKQLASRAGWSPYEGQILRGRLLATLLRGQIVMREGHIIGSPRGQPLRFSHSSSFFTR